MVNVTCYQRAACALLKRVFVLMGHVGRCAAQVKLFSGTTFTAEAVWAPVHAQLTGAAGRGVF